MKITVGCAGWSVPKEHAARFPGEGSHLERYAQRLPAAEINSSFYRPHRPSTYAKWADAVPDGFRFAVKMPREITHFRRLIDFEEPLARFLSEVDGLGSKLGPLLVQLPPSLAFNQSVAESFFASLREGFHGNVVCEPRHPSWFRSDADSLLTAFQIARVAADPAPVPETGRPGGWTGLAYYRLHGSPQIYYSNYSAEYLEALARKLREAALTKPVWCIFDNTALGAAAANALTMLELLQISAEAT